MGVNPDLMPCKRDRPTISLWIQPTVINREYVGTAFPSSISLPRCLDGCRSCLHLQRCKKKDSKLSVWLSPLGGDDLWSYQEWCQLALAMFSLQNLGYSSSSFSSPSGWTSLDKLLCLSEPSSLSRKRDPNSCPRGLAVARNRWDDAREGPLPHAWHIWKAL